MEQGHISPDGSVSKSLQQELINMVHELIPFLGSPRITKHNTEF